MTEATDNLILPFLVHETDVRGRLVRLGSEVDDILSRHAYPEPVATLLAEMLTLAASLGSALKFDGILTVQTKGDGAIKMMVADVTSDGALRGYAQFDEEKLQTVLAQEPEKTDYSVPQLMGAGYLAFTVDQGDNTERYQGIVELEGAKLSDCIQHYFSQSDQVDMVVKLAAGKGEAGWRAGGITLQRLPEIGGEATGNFEESQETWRRAVVFLSSVKDLELLDPELPSENLLYRLFQEDGVMVFDAIKLKFSCRCDENRIATVLMALSADELEDCKVDGLISSQCEFCRNIFEFDDEKIAYYKSLMW
jgi:molecular chaperone Hsp33